MGKHFIRGYKALEEAYKSLRARDFYAVKESWENWPGCRIFCIVLLVLFSICLFSAILSFCSRWPELTRRKRLLGSSGILIGIFLLIMGTYFIHTSNPDNQLYDVPSLMEKDAANRNVGEQAIKGMRTAKRTAQTGFAWLAEFIKGKKPEDGLTEVERLLQNGSKQKPKDIKNLKAENISATDYKALREEADELEKTNPDSPLLAAIEAKLTEVPSKIVDEYAAMNSPVEPQMSTEEYTANLFRNRRRGATTEQAGPETTAPKDTTTPPTSGETGAGGKTGPAENNTSGFNPESAQRATMAGEATKPLHSFTLGGKSYDINSAQDLRNAIRELDPNTATDAEIASIREAVSRISSKNPKDRLYLGSLVADIEEAIAGKIPETELAGNYSHFLPDGKTRTPSGIRDYSYNKVRDRLNQYLDEFAPSDYTAENLLSNQQSDLAALDNLLVSENLFRKTLHPQSPELQKDLDTEISGLVQKALTQKIENLQKQIDSAKSATGNKDVIAERVKELEEYKNTLENRVQEYTNPRTTAGPGNTSGNPADDMFGAFRSGNSSISGADDAGKSRNPFAGWAPELNNRFFTPMWDGTKAVVGPVWDGTKVTAQTAWKGVKKTPGAIKEHVWKPTTDLNKAMTDLRAERVTYEDFLSQMSQQRTDVLKSKLPVAEKRMILLGIDRNIENATKAYNEKAKAFGEQYPMMGWTGLSNPSVVKTNGSKLQHIGETSSEGGKIRVPLTEEEFIRYSDKPGAKDLGNGKYALEFESNATPEYAQDYSIEGHPLKVFAKGPSETPESGLLYDRVRAYAEYQTKKLNDLEREKAIYTQLGNTEAAARTQQSIDSIKNSAPKDLEELEALWARIENADGRLLDTSKFRQENVFTGKHSVRSDLDPKDAQALLKFYRTPEAQLENLGGLLMEGNAFTPMGELVRDGKLVKKDYWFEPRFVTAEGKPIVMGIPKGSKAPNFKGTKYEGQKVNAVDDISRGWDGWLYDSAGNRLRGMDAMAVESNPFTRKYTPDAEGRILDDGTPFFMYKGRPMPRQGVSFYTNELKTNRNDKVLLNLHRAKYWMAENPGKTLTGLWLLNTAADAAFPEESKAVKEMAAAPVKSGLEKTKDMVFGSGAPKSDELASTEAPAPETPPPSSRELPPPSTGSFFDVPGNYIREQMTKWAPDIAKEPYATAVGGAGLGAAIGTGLGALSYFLPDSTLSEEEKKRKSLLRSMLSGGFAGMTAGGILGGIDDFRRA